MTLSMHDLLVTLAVVIPASFIAGRYSNRIAFFHARTEQKLTVQEFLRSRD